MRSRQSGGRDGTDPGFRQTRPGVHNDPVARFCYAVLSHLNDQIRSLAVVDKRVAPLNMLVASHPSNKPSHGVAGPTRWPH
jgi:hypothetical protein